MNRLSIILAIAFVSYSLGAPQNISESQNGDQNHGLEHGSGQGLEKQDRFENGNVNVDTSTSDPSEIGVFGPKSKPKPPGGGDRADKRMPKTPRHRTAACVAMCTASFCVSGEDTASCVTCMSGCPK
ncbi:uncharacterized protein LOC132945815 isoform X1 [Metopolophium dirhodum]|uniref:uncharacterized protein LOC132945814 isoform X1 n=1 Tax=Metopolophium dirhodum TaxID=44670 RepID=UPI00298F7C2D|nr:uncharacterized protein LOC132945814 isoform X1 [Metopolophium dirhodum]XP_060871569.1 uncharacterized protein LOC132945815 isoform X1 [Metopolophium dirhodum]